MNNTRDTLDSGPEHDAPKLKGIFSSPAVPGKAPDPEIPKWYWFCKELGDGLISVQLLDENHLPTARQHILKKDAFLDGFTLEPDLGYRLLTQRVLMGDYYRNQGLALEAKIEYQKVLRIDEENIRANFGLGLAYLALNQLEKGRYAFEKLVGLEESFSAEHKHLFNEFGIALRKKGLFDEALAFYRRAKTLCPDDENLLMNIARAYFEKGDNERAYEELKECLEIAKSFREALAFIGYLRKRGILPRDPHLKAYFERVEIRRSELASLSNDG